MKTDEIDWFTTQTGVHIPLKKGQTKEEAIAKWKEKKHAEAESIYNSDFSAKHKINLSKQEYGILRQEVMRKNVAQKGKVKPTNFAYTGDYFYVYKTSGYDNFVPLVQLDIEEEAETIDYYEKIIGDKK